MAAVVVAEEGFNEKWAYMLGGRCMEYLRKKLKGKWQKVGKVR